MPIKVQCQCGKSLNAPDAAAGKAIRCPGCQSTIKVPAAGGAPAPAQSAPAAKAPAAKPPAGKAPAPDPGKPAAAKPAPKPAAKPAAPAVGVNDLSDLFDAEGFKAQSGPSCPGCGKPIRPGAAICTSCGLNLQTGERVASEVAPVKSGGGGGHGGHGGHGTDPNKALAHANEMMQRDQKMQEEMIRGSGLPWWALLIILMNIVGGGTIAAIVVVGLFAEKPDALGAMSRLLSIPRLTLIGSVMSVSFGVTFVIGRIATIIAGFKKSAGQGAMVLFVPLYDIIFCCLNWREYSGNFYMLVISNIGLITGIVFMAVGGF